jgi:hypothetical protein
VCKAPTPIVTVPLPEPDLNPYGTDLRELATMILPYNYFRRSGHDRDVSEVGLEPSAYASVLSAEFAVGGRS